MWCFTGAQNSVATTSKECDKIFVYRNFHSQFSKNNAKKSTEKQNDLDDLTAPETNGQGAGHIICSVHDGKCTF